MTVATKLTIPDVIERFADYFSQPQNGAWGSLHNVLDDGNVSDSNVNFCLDRALDRGDYEGAELAKLLLEMSKTQRLKLPSAVDAYVKSLSATPQMTSMTSPKF